MQVKRKNPAGSPSPQRAQGRRSSDPSNPAKPAESFAGFCRARTLGHFQAASDVETPCHMAATRAYLQSPPFGSCLYLRYLCQTVQSNPINPSIFVPPSHSPSSATAPRSAASSTKPGGPAIVLRCSGSSRNFFSFSRCNESLTGTSSWSFGSGKFF